MATFRSYTTELLATITWARGYYGERLTGWIALMSDLISDGATAATQARFDTYAPDDALPYIGDNKQIERYAIDTTATYRARLLRGFSTWEMAGTRAAIVTQFRAAGYPDAQIYEPKDWPSRPVVGYTSQFWVVIPDATGVSSAPFAYGSGPTYGDGHFYGGITGLTAAQIAALRALLRKWKRSTTICREIIFHEGGILYGTGHTYGDGSVYGGTSASIHG